MPSKEQLEVLGKAIALAGLLFTAFTYANNLWLEQKKARYSEIRSLVQRYEADGIRDAEHDLSTRLLYYRVDGLDPNDPTDYPDRLYDEIAKELLFGANTSEGSPGTAFIPRLLDIADFYAEVSFCLELSICDVGTGKRFFCPRATSFAVNNGRLISYYSEYSNSPDWAKGLQSLVARCGG
jgi:hypothetical protein